MIFFIDFDGTIAEQNVCGMMIKRFAKPGWKKLNQLWQEGILSTTAVAKKTLALVLMTPQELADLAFEEKLDPHFIDFANWAGKNDFPIHILSDGYGDYIGAMLERDGISLPYYANKLKYDSSCWTIETPYYNEHCGRCGVCKSKLILDMINTKVTTVYIGDGYTDRCPIYLTDLVFAKNNLAEYCREKEIPFHKYQNFGDILDFFNVF